ncbi:MAG: glutathione peroxidase [Ferruginibacter sp.]
MTIKQQILKTVYPLFIKLSGMAGKNTSILKNEAMPETPVYEIPLELNTGEKITLDKYKGKKILIVNTASDCGYTSQYEGLQALHEKYHDKVQVIGFPANDFGAQEKGSDETIASFCQVNFGVSFPLAKKASVLKNDQQQPLYKWLTHEDQNGWNYVAPTWNFCKYVIDEEGNLTHFFEAGTEPGDKALLEALSIK